MTFSVIQYSFPTSFPWTEKLVSKLGQADYRHAYMMEGVKTWIARQVRTLREQRDWSQEDLGRQTGKPQSAISRVEDPDYGKLTLQTLFDLSRAYDLPLLVQFVEWGDWLSRMDDVSTDALRKESFNAAALNDVGTAQIVDQMQPQIVIDPFGRDQSQSWNFNSYPAANTGIGTSILMTAIGSNARTVAMAHGMTQFTINGRYVQSRSIFDESEIEQERNYDLGFETQIRVPPLKLLEISEAENG